MSGTSQEPRFQHHGQPAETREAWAARIAEAAARAHTVEDEGQAAARRAAEQAAQTAKRVDRPARTQSQTRFRPVHVAVLAFFGFLVLLWGLLGRNTAWPPTPIASPARPASPMQPASAPVRSSTYDLPAIDPSPQGWWCLCYKTVLHTAHTSCRRSADTCETLRAMIQGRGNSEILQGTAGVCRHVRESYPWETLGHHDAWRESVRSQAVQAFGVCALN